MTNSINSWIRQKRVERAKNLAEALRNQEFKAGLIEKARRDPVFFFNQFCWTYDPRPEAKPNHFPFLTYPFQDDYIRHLEESFKRVEDVLTDKSRDMGVSWMILGWIVWHWLFDKSFNALVGSRKEDLVDNSQVDSLFGKMDYIIRRLPAWILPAGYEHEKHRTFSRIVNPESGNAIQGESANRDFSRQGRYSLVFLDEFAFWDHADSVWTATADSAPIRVVVSTPHGKSNKFADLRFSSKIKVITLHWSLHPFKNQDWYESEKKRRNPREVAQELDIDYESSGSERVFSLRINKELRDHVVIDPFEVPKDWNFRGGLDYGTRNKSSFHVYVRDYDKGHYSIWEWRRNMEDLKSDGFKGSMVQAIAKMLFECPYYDYLDHIRADPNLWVDNVNSEDEMKSVIRQIIEEIEILQKQHQKENKVLREIKPFMQGAKSDIACIEVVNRMWADPTNPQLKFFKSCQGQIHEFEELEWEDWSESQQTTRNIREKIKDRNNHSWDDFKYYIMSYQEAAQKKTEKAGWGTGGWFIEQLSRQGVDIDLPE